MGDIKYLLHLWNEEMQQANRETVDIARIISQYPVEKLNELSEEEQNIYKNVLVFMAVYGDDFLPY